MERQTRSMRLTIPLEGHTVRSYRRLTTHAVR